MPDRAPRSIRSTELPREHEGTAPGTLLIESTDRPHMVLFDFSEKLLEEHVLDRIEDVIPFIDKESLTWIDIRGIGHRQTFEKLGEIFHIHPLALEDMVNVPQRPKTEVFPDQQLIITRMVLMNGDSIQTEQFAILFGKGFVITVQEEPEHDCLEPLRNRIRHGRGTIRTATSDYIAYALFDAVIDGFFPVLEACGEALDELELRVLKGQVTSSADIFSMKRELLALRRAIWPQRDVLAQLLRDESPHIQPETRPYFRDTYDHAVQIMDMVETFREIASSLMDLLMSGVSNRLNEVMKVLTIVSTIFLPMTFVAGVYGMNFNPDKSPYNMPELNWEWGYPFSIAVMALSAGVLLLYYRTQGWIGRRGDNLGRVLVQVRRARRAFGPPTTKKQPPAAR